MTCSHSARSATCGKNSPAAPASSIRCTSPYPWSGTRTIGAMPSARATRIMWFRSERLSSACSASKTMKSNPASFTISTVSTDGIFMKVPMGGTWRPGSGVEGGKVGRLMRSLSHVMSRGSCCCRLVDNGFGVVRRRGEDVRVGRPERVARLVLIRGLGTDVFEAGQRRVDRVAVGRPGLRHGLRDQLDLVGAGRDRAEVDHLAAGRLVGGPQGAVIGLDRRVGDVRVQLRLRYLAVGRLVGGRDLGAVARVVEDQRHLQ